MKDKQSRKSKESLFIRRKRTAKHVIGSFGYAIEGIIYSIKSERNLRIHFTVAIIVVLISIYFQIDRIEWLFIILAISATIAMEMINTAIENVVDLATEELHPLAKKAKDVAAGAVLMQVVFSIIIGLVIFLPKIF